MGARSGQGRATVADPAHESHILGPLRGVGRGTGAVGQGGARRGLWRTWGEMDGVGHGWATCHARFSRAEESVEDRRRSHKMLLI